MNVTNLTCLNMHKKQGDEIKKCGRKDHLKEYAQEDKC